SVDRAIPDWIPLLVVTYHDQAAFFANERFLGEALSIPVLNGSAALGVEPDTSAFFDNFRLRDVSPETR
ncbi:MAG: hypothetical protein IT323_03665, partial [Anaerolineae bacterium]|nr:hypothetical protein [Anaerolineae bacterium]